MINRDVMQVDSGDVKVTARVRKTVRWVETDPRRQGEPGNENRMSSTGDE